MSWIGGLVEISSNPTEGPPTRTIGDPSTGTELQAPGMDEPSTGQPVEMPETPPPALKITGVSGSPRGLHLTHLPKAGTFTVDGALVSPAPSAGTSGSSSGAGPSHASSSTQLSGAPGPIQYETKLNVLVVDDDPLTRKLMSRMLTRLGCRVTTAENGEMALELILTGQTTHETPSSEDTGSGGLSLDGVVTDSMAAAAAGENRYAVVFLDNQMPVLSGLEAVAKLRTMGRRDFVVGVTGNALLSDQQEYLDAGVDQ